MDFSIFYGILIFSQRVSSHATKRFLEKAKGLQEVRQDFFPGIYAEDVGIGQGLAVPRAGHQKNLRPGRGNPMGMLMPVFDECLIGNTQRMLFVIEMKLIVGNAFSS